MDNNIKMMEGSTTGLSYLLIGKRGHIGLGIKTVGLMPDPVGNNNRFYMALKLRSSAIGAESKHPEQQEPSSLADSHPLTPKTAWPDITFDKCDSGRCSVVVGCIARGDINLDPVSVIAKVLDDGLIDKVVDLVIEKAGAEHIVLRKTVIVAWLQESFEHAITGLKKKQQAVQAFHEEAEAQLGVAGFQAQLLSKLLKANEQQVEPAHEVEVVSIAKATAEGTTWVPDNES